MPALRVCGGRKEKTGFCKKGIDRDAIPTYIINMTNETRTEFKQVRTIKAGLVTFQDGFRIQFLQAVPAWVGNRAALEIRAALESGDLFAAEFPAFRIVPAVESFL